MVFQTAQFELYSYYVYRSCLCFVTERLACLQDNVLLHFGMNAATHGMSLIDIAHIAAVIPEHIMCHVVCPQKCKWQF